MKTAEVSDFNLISAPFILHPECSPELDAIELLSVHKGTEGLPHALSDVSGDERPHGFRDLVQVRGHAPDGWLSFKPLE